MKKKIAGLVVLCLVFVVCLYACAGESVQPTPGAETKPPESTGQPAPANKTETRPAGNQAGAPVVAGDMLFKGQTLNGDTISSDIFEAYDLTMVNLWATWCPPCVGEIEELQKVYAALPEGANLIGMCLDGEEEPELAKQILADNGAKYENLASFQGDNIPAFLATVEAIPTTLFVDSKGNLVGEPVVGVPRGNPSEAYLQIIQERLAQAK